MGHSCVVSRRRKSTWVCYVSDFPSHSCFFWHVFSFCLHFRRLSFFTFSTTLIMTMMVMIIGIPSSDTIFISPFSLKPRTSLHLLSVKEDALRRGTGSHSSWMSPLEVLPLLQYFDDDLRLEVQTEGSCSDPSSWVPKIRKMKTITEDDRDSMSLFNILDGISL